MLILNLWAITSLATALPERCLQAPERSSACPHLLYKKSKQAIAALSVKENGIVCLCMSDIAPLLITTQSVLEKIDQQRALTALSQEYQLNQEQISALIRD